MSSAYPSLSSSSGCVAADSTFAYPIDHAEIAIRHLLLNPAKDISLRPSAHDEACMAIVYLSNVDDCELHDMSGLIRSGSCAPGSVDVIATRGPLVLKAAGIFEALVVSIPHLRLSVVPENTSDNRLPERTEAHDSYDPMGLELGLAFLAAVRTTGDARRLSTAHLARALGYHFALKHAWAQDDRNRAHRSRLAPWQVREASSLLSRGDLTIRDIALACRLSSRVFSRLFRATFELSPNDWRDQRRIDAIKKLLLDPDVSLANAALRAGFSDQASMSRFFRRKVGESPGAWRTSKHGLD